MAKMLSEDDKSRFTAATKAHDTQTVQWLFGAGDKMDGAPARSPSTFASVTRRYKGGEKTIEIDTTGGRDWVLEAINAWEHGRFGPF